MSRNIRHEFPDFDLATLPTLPAGFDDVSWHNDTSPSFLHEMAGLIVFIDYADANRSEYPVERRNGTFKRFLLARYDSEDGSTQETLCTSNEWADILAAIDPYLADLEPWERLGYLSERAYEDALGHVATWGTDLTKPG